MKATTQLKATASSTYVRSAAAVATLVPLAAILGGIRLSNHNETLLAKMSADDDEKTPKRKTLLASTHVRAAGVATALVPLAAILGGTRLPNHNETVLRGPVA
jgi:hypothetical protein